MIELPAQTMADDSGSSTSVLPMGSLYEAVQLLFFDVVSLRLRELLGQGRRGDAATAHEPRVSTFGINLGFAIKRWPQPQQWARVVREELDLDTVQFSFDLLDPWWPEHESLAAQAREVADAYGIRIHSAQVGLAMYTYNGLLHPDPDARAAAVEWWRRAFRIAAELGASAMGGPVGAVSIPELDEPARARTPLRRTGRDAADPRGGRAGRRARCTARRADAAAARDPVVDRRVCAARPDLEGAAVPLQYVLDVGHALFRPLYGSETRLRDWLEPLAASIGVLHVQNTDFEGDSHWGWPDERGRFDVAGFGADVARRASRLPVFLELFDAFEADDGRCSGATSSVEYCRVGLARGRPGAGSRPISRRPRP